MLATVAEHRRRDALKTDDFHFANFKRECRHAADELRREAYLWKIPAPKGRGHLFSMQAVCEDDIASKDWVYLFAGSKSTGGFCVIRRGLPEMPKLGHILGKLLRCGIMPRRKGDFIRYKGRTYCWCSIKQDGSLVLSPEMQPFLRIMPGMELLSTRSGDIAFTMRARGPLLEKEKAFTGKTEVFLIE